MRPVNIGRLGIGNTKDRLADIERAIRAIEAASYEHNVLDIGAAFELTGTITESHTIDAGTGTAAEVRNILVTLLSDMKRGGATRT